MRLHIKYSLYFLGGVFIIAGVITLAENHWHINRELCRLVSMVISMIWGCLITTKWMRAYYD